LLVSTLFVFFGGVSAAFASYPTARSGATMAFDESRRSAVLFGGVTKPDVSRKRYVLDDTWEWTGRRWARIYPKTSPAARAHGAMVYDSQRNRHVLFGGYNDTNHLADTWVFSRGNWSRVETSAAPPARRFPAMAFDRARGTTILFGGLDATTTFSDTWEFDGITWRQLLATGPELTGPLLAYDEARGEMLLVGSIATDSGSETWRWSGEAWVKVETEFMPKCVTAGTLTYQAHTQTMLLVGGLCGAGISGGTVFEFDGTDWAVVTTTPALGSLSAHAAAYDRIRGDVVMFGGVDESGERNETVRYNSGRIVESTVVLEASSPAPRSLFAFASDPESGVIWLYGGHNDRIHFNDLWMFAGGRWELRVSDNRPTGCSYPVSAFDTDRKRMVVVCESSAIYEWDGSEWHSFSGLKEMPKSRRFSSMAYDPVSRRTILFGGWSQLTDYLNETWAWNGSTWTRVGKTDAPHGRSLAALFFDPQSNKLMLFGGIGRKSWDNRVQRYNDTYAWDGSKWVALKPTTLPAPRYGTQVGVDAGGRPIMFGGKDENEIYINEQWSWNGTNWVAMTPSFLPEPRMNGAMAVDPATGQLTLFAGYAGKYFSEAWFWNGTSWNLEQAPSGRSRSTRTPFIP
jgi:hypothetical protein